MEVFGVARLAADRRSGGVCRVHQRDGIFKRGQGSLIGHYGRFFYFINGILGSFSVVFAAELSDCELGNVQLNTD